MESMIREIADTFINKMQVSITAEEMAQVRTLNSMEKMPGVCHTHDFCDANMVMADAFEQITKHMVDADSTTDCALWNGAWDLAKRKQFAIAGPADSWKAWDPAGWDADIETKLIELGMIDSTWHNDTAPSFSDSSEVVRLWIGEADGSEREQPMWPRFNLSFQTDEFEDLANAEKFEWILPALEKALKETSS